MGAFPSVAECQGLYGGFLFPELLLQKIWWRGDFDRAALCTTEGTPVRVLDPGRWNRLGGPDFLGARLDFGGAGAVTGDVELHLDAADWEAHGHARDPAYAGVRLHVVLFPPARPGPTRGVEGREIPVAVLLPWLHRGLEEFAADEVLEGLAGRPWSRAAEELGRLPPDEVWGALRALAARRWAQRLRFAALRRQRLGWDGACHHAALEVLGYRANRAPMLRLAAACPRDDWVAGRIGPAEAWAREAGGWRRQGVRPANDPRRRLEAYAAWQRNAPGWPDAFRAWAASRPVADPGAPTAPERRRTGLPRRRVELAATLGLAGGWGARFDNLVCDALLPLAAADGVPGLEGWWFHWCAGDAPAAAGETLRRLGVVGSPARPRCHGWVQGMLGWLLEREAEAARTGGEPAKSSLASPGDEPKPPGSA